MIIIDFSAYHGHTVAVLDLSPYKDGSGRGKPDYVHVAPTPNVYSGKYTQDEFPNEDLADKYALEVSVTKPVLHKPWCNILSGHPMHAYYKCNIMTYNITLLPFYTIRSVCRRFLP